MTWLWALAVLTVVFVVACDRVPLTSPTGSTISLSIDKSILPINGQPPSRRWLPRISGTPVHNGTTVTFQSSLGRTDPIEAQTVNGMATVTFPRRGTTSGTGVIHAFSAARAPVREQHRRRYRGQDRHRGGGFYFGQRLAIQRLAEQRNRDNFGAGIRRGE